MGTHLHDVYYCNLEKNQVLNNRISNRNLPTSDLEQTFFSRPSKTRQIKFPILDCRLKSNVSMPQHQIYNTKNIFNPGYRAPYSGYNVDKETNLFNQNRILQNCPQNDYIPNSSSDLYNSGYLVNLKDQQKNYLVQQQYNFNSFNPNKCDIGMNLFQNHTRQQTKNVKLVKKK
jgi:hypothetical protein